MEMTRRKSLARRTPTIVYLLRVQAGENKSYIKAWESDEYGHAKTDEYFGIANIEADLSVGMVTGEHWFTSQDTDYIWGLSAPLREGLWAFDDAIRKANS